MKPSHGYIVQPIVMSTTCRPLMPLAVAAKLVLTVLSLQHVAQWRVRMRPAILVEETLGLTTSATPSHPQGLLISSSVSSHLPAKARFHNRRASTVPTVALTMPWSWLYRRLCGRCQASDLTRTVRASARAVVCSRPVSPALRVSICKSPRFLGCCLPAVTIEDPCATGAVPAVARDVMDGSHRKVLTACRKTCDGLVQSMLPLEAACMILHCYLSILRSVAAGCADRCAIIVV
jgi:hypothetical protein